MHRRENIEIEFFLEIDIDFLMEISLYNEIDTLNSNENWKFQFETS